MVPAILVIDDFLPDPHALRARGLASTYAVGGRYPGLNSVERVPIPHLDRIVSSIMGRAVHAPWSEDFSHGHFRVALASDDKPGRIHIDPSQLSGILYLSRPEDCRGGTEFYRHIRTGTDRVPMDERSLNAAGYSSYQDLQHDILDTDALDRSKWELSMTVPMRFNRLVLLQPHYWHTSGPGFGDSIENGRLIYVMFFKIGPAPGR